MQIYRVSNYVTRKLISSEWLFEDYMCWEYHLELLDVGKMSNEYISENMSLYS